MAFLYDKDEVYFRKIAGGALDDYELRGEPARAQASLSEHSPRIRETSRRTR
jgi:hypothetical protein